MDLTLRTADPEIENPERPKAVQILHSHLPLQYQEPSTLLLLDPPPAREPLPLLQSLASHSLHRPPSATPGDFLLSVPQLRYQDPPNLSPAQAPSQYTISPNVQTYAPVLHSFDHFRGPYPSSPTIQFQTNPLFPFQRVDDSGNSGSFQVTESKPPGSHQQGTRPQCDIYSKHPGTTRADFSGAPYGEGKEGGGGWEGTVSVRKEESWERLRGSADGLGHGGEADGVEMRRDPR